MTDKPTKWLIWSMEHNGFWRPDSMGYCRDWKDAGRYSFDAALAIVDNANYATGSRPNEAMIPENPNHER